MASSIKKQKKTLEEKQEQIENINIMMETVKKSIEDISEELKRLPELAKTASRELIERTTKKLRKKADEKMKGLQDWVNTQTIAAQEKYEAFLEQMKADVEAKISAALGLPPQETATPDPETAEDHQKHMEDLMAAAQAAESAKSGGLDEDQMIVISSPKPIAVAGAIDVSQMFGSMLPGEEPQQVVPVPKPQIEDHFLPTTEYIHGKYKNEYIVLHHTAGHDNPYKVIDNWGTDTRGRVGTEFVLGGQRCYEKKGEENYSNPYDGKLLSAFPAGNQCGHIGECGSPYMTMHSVGIEVCNIGWVDKNGKSYTGHTVLDNQICELDEPFKGYTQWHNYSDAQIETLRRWLLYIADRDNIDLHVGLYQWIKSEGPTKAFDFHRDACNGLVKGLLTHANIRKDKVDLYPHPKLVNMILNL